MEGRVGFKSRTRGVRAWIFIGPRTDSPLLSEGKGKRGRKKEGGKGEEEKEKKGRALRRSRPMGVTRRISGSILLILSPTAGRGGKKGKKKK